VIRVQDVVQHYGIRPVLKGVSLTVEPGELLALMGPNGMGKSTLLAAIAGITSPQKGYVEIDGVRRRSSPEAELAIRRKAYYLPDHPWLPMQRTAREYLVDVARLYSVEDDRLFDHIERLLDLFALRDRADAPISALSTGQKKKVAISGALVSDAPIQLMDEPFSGGLDPSALLALRKVMQHLAHRDDVTLVIATPMPEIVETLADSIAIIRAGELITIGTPDELRASGEGEESLEEVLERLINPKTLEHVTAYFDKVS
jgi:ABC-type multidrug transport system ATPase subunit